MSSSVTTNKAPIQPKVDSIPAPGLLKLLSKLSYIEIEAEKELTAKEEHEQVKQIMLTGSKRFVTNFLLKNEH